MHPLVVVLCRLVDACMRTAFHKHIINDGEGPGLIAAIAHGVACEHAVTYSKAERAAARSAVVGMVRIVCSTKLLIPEHSPRRGELLKVRGGLRLLRLLFVRVLVGMVAQRHAPVGLAQLLSGARSRQVLAEYLPRASIARRDTE